jgi:hypothetical protein
MTTTLTAPEGQAPTGVRCGNHRYAGEVVHHEDAAAVKACYGRRYDQEDEARAERAAEAAVERHFEDRGYDEHRSHEEWEARQGLVSYEEARDRAEAAAQLPDPAPAARVDWAAIRAIPVGDKGDGYYALPGEDDQPEHYRVRRLNSGYVVLDRMVGGGFERQEGEFATVVLGQIATNPDLAGELFATSTGNCRDCNRFLRVKSSVDAHRGPKCARKHAR